MIDETDPSNLSGSYALNALDPAEVADFEAQLAKSDATRYEVTELRDTAVLLGLAAEPHQPPASLKASIMSQLDATPQLPRLAEPAVPAPQLAAASTTAAMSRARARWFTRPAALLTAAAAAILIVLSGAVAVTSFSATNQQQAQADQLAAINAASDSQRKVVTVASGGTATLVWSGQLGSSALLVDGLKPLSADHVYELWYIDAAGARPAGTFTTNGAGTTWRVLEGTMGAGDTVGVTVEPRGGSTAPTTDPVIVIASA